MIQSFYNKCFPTLDVNEEYCLREQEIKDTDAFFEYYADPEVGKYILANKPQNIAEASAEIHYCRNLFRYRRGIYWTLARKADDKMIGAIGFYLNNQHHRGEICYDLSREYWRKGVMTQALQKVVQFAFREMEVNRIEAVTIAENKASIAILKRLGFIHEGVLKQYRYYNGKSHDVEIYSLISTEEDISSLLKKAHVSIL